MENTILQKGNTMFKLNKVKGHVCVTTSSQDPMTDENVEEVAKAATNDAERAKKVRAELDFIKANVDPFVNKFRERGYSVVLAIRKNDNDDMPQLGINVQLAEGVGELLYNISDYLRDLAERENVSLKSVLNALSFLADSEIDLEEMSEVVSLLMPDDLKKQNKKSSKKSWTKFEQSLKDLKKSWKFKLKNKSEK